MSSKEQKELDLEPKSLEENSNGSSSEASGSAGQNSSNASEEKCRSTKKMLRLTSNFVGSNSLGSEVIHEVWAQKDQNFQVGSKNSNLT